MTKILQFIGVMLLFIGCNEQKTENNKQIKSENTPIDSTETHNRFAIVIHGGAGTILKENMTPELEAAYTEVLETAIRKGHSILESGGTALDAVEQTIHILENSPLFNAGKGAVFTNDGRNELDASIMSGKDLNAGAIAGVTSVKNPISLARAVMERSEHVMFAREGAEQFARENGIELVDPSYFYTEDRMKALKRAQEKEKIELDHSAASAFFDPIIGDQKFGTVGCVALDRDGNLAAGTSTGGMTNKRWGRVGDAPIIGAGTYANNATCAISSTGWGEYFIRGVVAYDISAMMEYGNKSLAESARIVIQEKQTALGGSGGVIGLDRQGNMIMEFNTPGMYRASMDQNNTPSIGIYKD